MIVDSIQKRTGGLKTASSTHRTNNAWPIVMAATVTEVGGDV